MTNNKRKFQDEFKNCHNQDGTADFKTLSDEKLRDIIIKDLEQYKDGQNRPEHTKHFECICNYEDFCNFFNFPKSKRVKRDESDNGRKEKIDLDVKNENKDLKNEQTQSEQLKVIEKNDKSLEKALQHGSNLEPIYNNTESDCNPIKNLSFVFESSNSLNFNDKDLNSSKNIIETIDFKDEFMTALKLSILKFITNNVCITYRKSHLNRLEDLEKNFVIMGKCKLDYELYLSIFDLSYDNELLNELINSDIGKLFSFNRKTYKKVIKIMKKLFSNTKAKNIIRKLNKLPDDQKKIFLYYEFFTCYKYAVNIPELLTISGLFKEKKISFITFVLHIINLISNSVDNIKNRKIFIKFMISIVFKISYRDKFDIFELQDYNVKCNKKLHNLYFFTWEFGFNKQKRIKNRKSVNSFIFKRDSSLVKAVLLTFLYQHMFYMKFLNITDQDFIRFQDFILIIIESDDCAGCLLNEILKTTSDD